MSGRASRVEAMSPRRRRPLRAVLSLGVATLLLAGCRGGLDGPSDAAVGFDGPSDEGVARLDGGTDGRFDLMPTDMAPACPAPSTFDYTCSAGDPSSCPQGLCIGNLCIAPVLDPHRWDDCGDGTCDRCETALRCPADCGEPPKTTGQKVYDDDTTLTVWIHGFNNSGGGAADTTYGAATGCSDVGEAARQFGIDRPCGNTPATENAPDQIVGVEYYGDRPDSWLTPSDVGAIEAYPYSGTPYGLQRYGLIVAKFIRHKLQTTGATHVNLACHSMGCLISRYLIENDIEGLASEGRIVRWVTSAGVIAGARLARLYDNPSVQAGASAIGLEVSDFILMNPDYVEDTVCSWDHKLYEGNNPLYAGMLIHHVGGSNPTVAGFPLLDLNNPDDDPNDGVMYTDDEYLHTQSAAASLVTPSGAVLAATRSFLHADHLTLPDTDAFRTLAAAALFQRRKVIVTLESVTLKKEHEFSLKTPLEAGSPPDELSVETEVRYDPYVQGVLGHSALIAEDKVAYRTPEVLLANVNVPITPKLVVYEGPIFDAMTELQLKAQLVEVDWYPHQNVRELSTKATANLVAFQGSVALTDHEFTVENDDAKATFSVQVLDLY